MGSVPNCISALNVHHLKFEMLCFVCFLRRNFASLQHHYVPQGTLLLFVVIVVKSVWCKCLFWQSLLQQCVIWDIAIDLYLEVHSKKIGRIFFVFCTKKKQTFLHTLSLPCWCNYYRMYTLNKKCLQPALLNLFWASLGLVQANSCVSHHLSDLRVERLCAFWLRSWGRSEPVTWCSFNTHAVDCELFRTQRVLHRILHCWKPDYANHVSRTFIWICTFFLSCSNLKTEAVVTNITCFLYRCSVCMCKMKLYISECSS